ncbi:MAG: hypothetical protein CMJ74_01870 [Planctomycetaceae bacterium]|nr:hypothetical protein [Planctomycetaceae bacterium]
MKQTPAVWLCIVLLIVVRHHQRSHAQVEAENHQQKLKAAARWEDFVEREGRIYDPKTNRPHTGPVALRYGNEGLALGHCRDGLLDGTSTSWYRDGKKRSEHTYQRGLLEGLATTWYPNGQTMSQGPYRKGKLHGLWISWDERGKEVSQHTYRDGIRNDN